MTYDYQILASNCNFWIFPRYFQFTQIQPIEGSSSEMDLAEYRSSPPANGRYQTEKL